ncbi:proline racemase [Corynebacterium sp. HMSC064E08]|uniref:proline racemase n=1 Tax=Corynebacterium sp. HMSC064E08 TaxID=1739324 RepID=UPI0008A5DC10|nr:proline racemase [Corynebacterium sp. HMSC064E08]OFK33262.1 proline racemase [Corynebacterium sp. HMSC064E08]
MSFPAPDTIVQNWLNERAEAGVVRAKVVTDVTYSEGVLTVTIEPEKFIDLDTWNLLNEGHSDSLGDFYATELGWTNKQSAYLREMVTALRVVDATRSVIETVDTAAYQRKKNPQFPADDSVE